MCFLARVEADLQGTALLSRASIRIPNIREFSLVTGVSDAVNFSVLDNSFSYE
jgi:hypothetical protein